MDLSVAVRDALAVSEAFFDVFDSNEVGAYPPEVGRIMKDGHFYYLKMRNTQ